MNLDPNMDPNDKLAAIRALRSRLQGAVHSAAVAAGVDPAELPDDSRDSASKANEMVEPATQIATYEPPPLVNENNTLAEPQTQVTMIEPTTFSQVTTVKAPSMAFPAAAGPTSALLQVLEPSPAALAQQVVQPAVPAAAIFGRILASKSNTPLQQSQPKWGGQQSEPSQQSWGKDWKDWGSGGKQDWGSGGQQDWGSGGSEGGGDSNSDFWAKVAAYDKKQGWEDDGTPKNERVTEFCKRFDIEPKITKELQWLMDGRKETFEEDMHRLWTDLERCTRSVTGLLISKINQMKTGTFVGLWLKPDPELTKLIKKFKLDDEAQKRLNDVLSKHEPEKRQEYYEQLTAHCEASPKPSALVMKFLGKLGKGESLGAAPERPKADKGKGKGKDDRDDRRGRDDRDDRRGRDDRRDRDRDRDDRRGRHDDDRDRDDRRSRRDDDRDDRRGRRDDDSRRRGRRDDDRDDRRDRRDDDRDDRRWRDDDRDERRDRQDHDRDDRKASDTKDSDDKEKKEEKQNHDRDSLAMRKDVWRPRKEAEEWAAQEAAAKKAEEEAAEAARVAAEKKAAEEKAWLDQIQDPDVRAFFSVRGKDQTWAQAIQLQKEDWTRPVVPLPQPEPDPVPAAIQDSTQAGHQVPEWLRDMYDPGSLKWLNQAAEMSEIERSNAGEEGYFRTTDLLPQNDRNRSRSRDRRRGGGRSSKSGFEGDRGYQPLRKLDWK